MKKILLTLLLLVSCFTAQAKVVKIILADGTTKVFTSSELSAIDFNDDGTLTVATYDGQVLPALAASYDEVVINDEPLIYETYADTLSFNINADGIPVNLNIDRPITKMNYVYPSADPSGEPITLSGTILIPENIWQGKNTCRGILMVNHYTKFHRNEAPTISNGELESMLLANPFYPNYIIVESDFYGFGATVRFPQAFLQGLVNARASLDGLLAARQLLDEMQFDYGPLCFNIGYSSAGFDALAVLKLRDKEYADVISFDKTFSGGGPSDVREAYRQYVLIDSTAYNAVPPLLMVSTNETQKLGLSYDDVFQPYISGRIDELINSKNFSSWPVCDSIGREKKVHEILSETYCDLSSPESQAVQELFTQLSMTYDDWTPDTAQHIYLFHSRGDDYVPIQSARPMISFLRGKGYTPSIIPGKTNLQTNFLVKDMGHLAATIVFFVQTLAAIEAWPVMYQNGQLNPIYKEAVSKDVDIVGTMRQLDALGIDCRTIIKTIIAKMTAPEGEEPQELNPMTIMAMISQQLSEMDLTLQELVEMADDSGVDVGKLISDLVTYFMEQPEDEPIDEPTDEPEDGMEPTEQTIEESAPIKRAACLYQLMDESITPAQRYEQQLRDWLKGQAKGKKLEIGIF